MRDRLRQIRVFASLDDEQLDRVAAIGRTECVAAGGLVVSANEPASALRGVLDGRVQIAIAAPGRPPLAVATVSAGEILGWSALLPQSRWLASARALKNTTLVVVDGQRLAALCQEDHELGFHVMRRTFESVAHRLHDTWLQFSDSYCP